MENNIQKQLDEKFLKAIDKLNNSVTIIDSTNFQSAMNEIVDLSAMMQSYNLGQDIINRVTRRIFETVKTDCLVEKVLNAIANKEES